jgi:hypothetical protein
VAEILCAVGEQVSLGAELVRLEVQA